MPGAESNDTWDALIYGRYGDERFRPFLDLLARVGALAPARVVDLGCGTGSGLAYLAERWPAAHLVGVDSSADMLSAAETELGALAQVRLIQARAQDWSPESAVDVVLSNALLQWIPDHADLLTRMAGWLAPGGWVAIQVPGNFEAPSHQLLRDLAESPQWTDRLRRVVRGADSAIETAGYLGILAGAGLTVDAWETTYLHVLTGADPVLQWTSGTALRPVLSVLDDVEAQEFSCQYAERLRVAYPADGAGRVVFPFRRIFAVGHR